MGYEDGHRYTLEVATAEVTESANTGTLGLVLYLNGDDGAIAHTLWLTPKTKDRVRRDLRDCLGLTEVEIDSESFWNEPSALLAGKTVVASMVEDTYNGKTRIKVGGLLAPNAMKPKAKRVLALLRGESAPTASGPDDDGQDEIPF